MDTFTTRYKKLNQHQKKAVDHIHGPLAVLAGPGTGKTELLSMRTANILRQTDTLPSNILCITFTDSGASNMRKRLSDIIGSDAYKVAIHTFHSFGSEVMNQNSEYFYAGMDMSAADELTTFGILRELFDELDYTNPLASKNNGEYVHIKAVASAISDIKRSGLTSDELLNIIDANESVCDAIEADLHEAFGAGRVSMKIAPQLVDIMEKAAGIPSALLPRGVTPYINSFLLSLRHAIDAALETGKTTTITAWKNQWLEKDETGTRFAFKDRKRHAKLRAVAHIYGQYIAHMQSAGLYDFDDMILQVIHALETHPDLRANLQEKYQYIMVDEFQDTNLAQLRILSNITDSVDSPNIMVVGDDDQAIFSFQGADSDTFHKFRQDYHGAEIIVLTDNYRSAAPILEHSRAVITQSGGRLESTIEGVSKLLTPHYAPDTPHTTLTAHASPAYEYTWVARDIARRIEGGVNPKDIAVIAKNHANLIAFLPYIHEQGIAVNYERRDNTLEHPLIIHLERVMLCIQALAQGEHDVVDSLLPEIISHPAFCYAPYDIWKLSLKAYRDRLTWLECMDVSPTFQPLARWLIDTSNHAEHESLEVLIDHILGTHPLTSHEENIPFISPLAEYYFGNDKRTANPEAYLDALEALRTIRDKLREHFSQAAVDYADFLSFLTMHRSFNIALTTVRHRDNNATGMIHLLTAHKSKGLEYEHVYVINSIDNVWGEKAVSGGRGAITYPANLQIQRAGDSYDERMRLYYVAMTRAKTSLTLSYATTLASGKEVLKAGFLADTTLPETTHPADTSAEQVVSLAEIAWRDRITQAPTADMKQLLASTLESYKLSATHLANFIDITSGGPEGFLLRNLLRFPQAKSPNAEYGTVIHATLQKAHEDVRRTGQYRAIEDILGDFEKRLDQVHMCERDHDLFLQKGLTSLSQFLKEKYHTFNAHQRTELGFGQQGVVVGEARLTGALDLVDIDEKAKTIIVTDYKTGKASSSWKASQDFEKIKLHKYRYQLMFYYLLITGSRDYSKYAFREGVLQFVEPSREGHIYALMSEIDTQEIKRFKLLIANVWQRIMTLDFPDISEYPQTYAGMLKFEEYLISGDENSQNA